MNSMTIAAAAALALAACSPQGQATGQDANTASAKQPSQAESEAYINKAEQEWAALATTKDPAVLERILADDYAGVSDEGTAFSKEDEIKWETEQPDDFTAAAAPKMTYRHFGDTVLAQGEQMLTPKGGGDPVKILWTDVWMFRDGKWQVVGSQNAMVPAKG